MRGRGKSIILHKEICCGKDFLKVLIVVLWRDVLLEILIVSSGFLTEKSIASPSASRKCFICNLGLDLVNIAGPMSLPLSLSSGSM